MRIGELAQLSGLTASRIRFYEASGLIKPERTANGYRDYSSGAVSMLAIIDSAQRAGFSLEEIRHLLPTGQGTWNHDDLLNALRHKVAEIEAMQKRLKASRASLLVAIESIENRPEAVDCAERAKWVMGQLQEKRVVSRKKKHSRANGRT